MQIMLKIDKQLAQLIDAITRQTKLTFTDLVEKVGDGDGYKILLEIALAHKITLSPDAEKWVKITADRPGKCISCSKEINSGDSIQWNNDTKEQRHSTCVPDEYIEHLREPKNEKLKKPYQSYRKKSYKECVIDCCLIMEEWIMNHDVEAEKLEDKIKIFVKKYPQIDHLRTKMNSVRITRNNNVHPPYVPAKRHHAEQTLDDTDIILSTKI